MIGHKTVLILILLLISTNLVIGFDLDSNEDVITLSPGGNKLGAVIVSKDVEAICDSEFVKLKDKIQIESSYSIPYEIIIPESTNIGIYRTYIELSDGEDIKYLNIKISVQKPFIVSIINFFNTSTGIYTIYTILVSLLIFILFYYWWKFK